MDVLSPFISILCHSDWLVHRQSCPRLDVVYPGRAWSFSPACTWHCSLHNFFLQAIPLFSSWYDLMLASLLWQCLTVPCFHQLCWAHSFVFFAVHETYRIFLSPFISKASRRVSSFFLSVQLSQRYVATGQTTLSLVLSSLKSVCCDFSIFSAVMPRSPVLCLICYGILPYTRHLLQS